MELHFLGTGDAFSSGGRNQSAYVLKTKDKNILMECGVTTLLALKRKGWSSSDIDMIFISHLHGDHIGGIPFLLLDRLVYGEKQPLTIVGPPEIKERINSLIDLLYPGFQKSLRKIKITYKTFTLEEKLVVEKDISVKAWEVNHSEKVNPHAYQVILPDKVIAFSGDTGWTETLVKIADGADIFICECNFFKTAFSGHIHYQKLAKEVKRLNCKKIMLTHLGEEMLDNLHQVKVPVAEDGLVVAL